MWPTLPIKAAGTSTSLFPNLGNSFNCISRQRRKAFPPIIFSNKRRFPTHRSFADWRQILFQQLDHQKTFSHLQETWQVTVAAKLRSATSWGSLQSSDQKYTSSIVCMLHISKLLLRLFAVFWSFRKVQFDQNVNCSDGDQFYFANFAQVIYFVTLGWWWWCWVRFCFVRWWKWTWTKFWAKVCFNVCRGSWEAFNFFLLLNLFLIKGLL